MPLPKRKPTIGSTTTVPPESKKRKRQEKLQQYGIDLPEIPGVPVEVIPLLVHALKVATKYFQNEGSLIYNDDWADAETLKSTVNDGNALDNLLDTIDSNHQQTEESKQQETRKLKMKDAVQAWLQAVKRFAKRHNANDHAQAEDPSNGRESKVSKSVPLACFQYVWRLGSEHKRVAVRRAALCMNRHLLDKSRDCRHNFFEESDHLWEWVQVLSAAASGEDSVKLRLWQREGHRLLVHLLEEGFDYPKLPVAEQYLRQACSLEVQDIAREDLEDFGSTTNMHSLRELRDIALKYGREEILRVTKLLQKCHKCMDVLVPRMGIDKHVSALPKAIFDNDSDNADVALEGDDDDDIEIDWEDGDDNDKDHVLAVERTLRAMESIGGFKGSGLEINLSKPPPMEASGENTPDMEAARVRFAKCAHFLSSRHLPRMSAWLEGLTKADRLHSPIGTASLILMSPLQGDECDRLREQLVNLRVQAISSLQSAARLGLYHIVTN